MGRGCIWTREEDDILREFYPTEGYKVCHRLQGRSGQSCKMRAKLLGIRYNNVPEIWTRYEDSILEKYYPTEGAGVCHRLPGRSGVACKSRANFKGIMFRGDMPDTSRPDGYCDALLMMLDGDITQKDAAEMLGISESTIRKYISRDMKAIQRLIDSSKDP